MRSLKAFWTANTLILVCCLQAAFLRAHGATLTVTNQPLTLVMPDSVREGEAVRTGRVILSEVATRTTVVTLSASDSQELSLPSEIIIPAGAIEGIFEFSAIDDGLLDGSQTVQVSASANGLETATKSVISHDRQFAILHLFTQPSISESNLTTQASIYLAFPVAKAVDVILSATPANQLQLPQRVRIEQYFSSVTFDFAPIQDFNLEGPMQIELVASVEGWGPGRASLTLLDDEQPFLSLWLPPQFDEGDGAQTNMARVSAGGILSSNLTVRLTSSETNHLTVPETVTIPAGSSNAFFDITVIENSVSEPSRYVTLSGAADGFPKADAFTSILNNDPVEIRFQPIESPQYTDPPVSVVLVAHGEDGSWQSNFKGMVALEAYNASGPVALSTNLVGPFENGVWRGPVQVLEPARLVRMRTTTIPGESEAFHVETPSIRIMPFLPTDIAIDSATKTVYATTLGNNPTFPRSIVAIDPITLTATNSYPLTIEPSTMEVAPQGGFLYIRSEGGTAFERFDFATKTVTSKINIASNARGMEFAIVGNAPDAVLICLVDTIGSNGAGVWRYENGRASNVPALSAIAAYYLETDAAGVIYGYQANNDYPLVRLGTSAVTVNRVLQANGFVLRGDRLYDHAGNSADARTLQSRGVYPALTNILESAMVEADPVLNRTFYLTGRFFSHTSFGRIIAFDTASRAKLAELPLPGLPSGPLRFLRQDTNRLVFANYSGQIWFIESKLLQPASTAMPDLRISQTLDTATEVGKPASITVTLQNDGPVDASLIRITNALPQGTKFLSGLQSTGRVTQVPYGFDWIVTELRPGQSATFTFSLSLDIGGKLTNTVSAVNYEGDSNFANNSSTLPLYVTLPEAGDGAFLLKYPVNDLVYDPVADKLLIATPSQAALDPNGIATLDPRTARLTAFAGLANQPHLLSRTPGGEYLYVSYKDITRVSRLTLPNFNTDLSFPVGEENSGGILYKYYAAGIEPLPSDPRTVVVWQMRAPHPMAAGEFPRGIAVFKDGVPLRNQIELVAAATESMLWDPSGDLLSFKHGADPQGALIRDLKRYTIDTNGISLAHSYPRLHYTIGHEIHLGLGHLVNSAGREFYLDPFRVSGGFSGAENAVTAIIDTNKARVFFVAPTAPKKWELRAYRLDNREPVGSLPLPNITGVPTELMLWGNDGLAFRASTNEIVLIRTQLRQPAREADLELTVTANAMPRHFLITVKNNGPATAVNVVVTNQFTNAPTYSWGGANKGSFSMNDLTWTIPTLEVGATAQLGFGVQSDAPALTDTVTVSASNNDPNRGNNTVQATTPAPAQKLVELPIQAADLIWSDALDQLVATVATNGGDWNGRLLTIHPTSLTARSVAFVGGGASKLAINANGSRLFVGANYSFRAITIPSFVTQTEIPIALNGANYSVAELKALPGAANSVILRRYVPGYSDLTVFDSISPRSNSVDVAWTGLLELGSTPTDVYYNPFAFIGFQRYSISPDGVAFVDTDPSILPRSVPLDLEWAEGNMIASEGSYFDPSTRTKIGQFKNVPISSIILYDQPLQQVFFASKESTNLILRAFDVTTQIQLGEEKFPTTLGSPSNLVRWPRTGFAFITTNGVGILNSTLIPNRVPTDLAIQVTPSAQHAMFDEEFRYEIVVTNIGPNGAANARLLARFSPNAGAIGATDGQIIVPLGAIPARGTARHTFVLNPPGSGTIHLIAKIIYEGEDVNPLNNSQSLTTAVVRPLARGDSFVVDERVNDIVYDSTRHLLYASSIDGNVIVLNPEHTKREATWPVSAIPGRMALSDDASQLYVSLANRTLFARIDPSTGLTNLQIDAGLWRLGELHAVPGRPRSFLISYGDNSIINGIRLFDDDQIHGGGFSDSAAGWSMAFGNSPDTFYVIGRSYTGGDAFRKVQIFPDGIRQVFWVDPLAYLNVGAIHFAHNRVYGDNGFVIDAEGGVITDKIEGIPPGSIALADASSARLLYVLKSAGIWKLRAYDIHTLAFLAEQALPFTTGAPTRFIRWAADGIGITTSSNELILARSVLLPTGPPANATLNLSLTQPLVAGGLVTLSATVTNRGPNEIAEPIVSIRLPAGATLPSPASHPIVTTSNLLSASLPPIPTGDSFTLTIPLQFKSAGLVDILGSVATFGLDTNLNDNLVRLSANVHFGLSADQAAVLDFPNTNIVYDPVFNLLHVVGIDTSDRTRGKLFMLDPGNGAIRKTIDLGPGLVQAAVSDDGSIVYVIGGNGARIHKVAVGSGTHSLFYDFGSASERALEIQTIPGSANKLAVVHQGEMRVPIAALIDGGIMKPQTGSWVRHLAIFSPTEALGFDSIGGKTYRTHILEAGIQLDSNGVTLVDGQMAVANALIYTSGGSVIDPVALTNLRRYSATGPVAPVTNLNHVAFATQTNIAIFDIATDTFIGVAPTPALQWPISKLTYAGADRFAMRTDARELAITRTTVLSNPPADTDSDGIPNDWELSFGLDGNNATDASGDLDHDGFINSSEYKAGTNPMNPASALRLQVVGSQNDISVTLNAGRGRTYVLQTSSSLNGPWTTANQLTAQIDGPITMPLPANNGGDHQFYRVTIP